MDYILRKFGDVGEIGLDSEIDTEFGRFYVKLYDGTFDACGYDTEAEAQARDRAKPAHRGCAVARCAAENSDCLRRGGAVNTDDLPQAGCGRFP